MGAAKKRHSPPRDRVAEYEAAIEESLRLSGPQMAGAFDLDREPATLRESYGGEFGQCCLLSRRFVERGGRFIGVSHDLNFLNGIGWDVHHEGILDQHKLIRELDSAVGTSITDLGDAGLTCRVLRMRFE